jgi:DNA adenine methylase
MSQAARIRVRPVVARLVARRHLRPAEASPIVKWAGGKSKLLDQLLARRPVPFRRYYEPFLGGGAFFFRLAPRDAVISDCNEDLMNMYRCVAWQVDGIIRRLRTHRERHSEEYFYATRERWNERSGRQSDVDRAAMFIYLNKTCYNGLWRVNRSGRFNVPMGRYTDPSIFDPAQLRSAAHALQRAQLRKGDYREVVDDAAAGDFLYFDPPYQPVSATANFTSYTPDSFAEADQRVLADTVRTLVARGCSVMVSNSDTPLIRAIYQGFDITQVSCSRAINSKASRRGAVNEVIITAP